MKSRAYCWVSALVLTAAVPGLALAQNQGATGVDQTSSSPENRPAVLDEIIVTAQKRQERISDVPLSITAVTGEQLARQGITSPDDLQAVIPGFSYQKSAFGAPIYSIRGIGFSDPAAAATPAVSVYIDQAPLPLPNMARGAGLDLERVEALKGPQGTLFGQNSTGGAINYIAAKPTDDFRAGVDVDYGRFNQINAGGFVSGALAPELRHRLAVRVETRDEWQQGFAPNDSQLGQAPDELGKRRFYNGRYLVDWTPSDAVSLLFSVSGWVDRSETQAQQFGGFAPSTARNAFNASTYAAYANLIAMPQDNRLAGWNSDTDYARDDSFPQFVARGEFQLSETLALTSITSSSRYREDSVTDVDGVAFRDQELNVNADIDAFSQELRLAGTVGRVDFTVGANYATEDTNEVQDTRTLATNNGFGPFRWGGVQNRAASDIETLAAFASFDFHLTEALTLQAGARYTTQERAYEGCLADNGTGDAARAFGAALGLPTTPGNCLTSSATTGQLLPVVARDLNEDNVSWRVSMNYKPNPELLIYANVTLGYKAGSFPVLPAASDIQFNPATQESILAYETGFKNSFLDRRVQMSGAVFYYDYTDKQSPGSISILGTTLRNLVNIPESRVYGAELEGTLWLIDGLRISGGVTYVNSEVESDPQGARDPFGRATSFIGEPFPNTPEWQANGDAEYQFALGAGYEGFVGGSVSYRSETQPVFGESPELQIEGYTLVDLRAGVQMDNGVRVQLWGRNVFDEYYRTNALRQIDSISYYVGMPATYGVSIGYRF